MFEELVLSPEELYYLAKTCNGKHLNYDYIAMMPDIQQRFAMYRDDCVMRLEKKGIVRDSWGEITVLNKAKDFLAPIWNGEFEASAAQITVAEPLVGRIFYIHRLQDQVRLVIRQEDGIHIFPADDIKVEMLACGLLPKGYEACSIKEKYLRTGAEPKEMILLKNIMTSGKQAVIEQFYRIDDWICRKQKENEYYILDAEEFYSVALRVLKGV